MTAQPSGTLLMIQLFWADCHFALKRCQARGPNSAHSSSMHSAMEEVFSVLSSCARPFPTSLDFSHCCHLMVMFSACVVVCHWSNCLQNSCTPQFVHSLSMHFKLANLSDAGQRVILISMSRPPSTSICDQDVCWLPSFLQQDSDIFRTHTGWREFLCMTVCALVYVCRRWRSLLYLWGFLVCMQCMCLSNSDPGLFFWIWVFRLTDFTPGRCTEASSRKSLAVLLRLLCFFQKQRAVALLNLLEIFFAASIKILLHRKVS